MGGEKLLSMCGFAAHPSGVHAGISQNQFSSFRIEGFFPLRYNDRCETTPDDIHHRARCVGKTIYAEQQNKTGNGNLVQRGERSRQSDKARPGHTRGSLGSEHQHQQDHHLVAQAEMRVGRLGNKMAPMPR